MLILVLLGLSSGTDDRPAEDRLVFVVHTSNKTGVISREFLRRAFKGEETYWTESGEILPLVRRGRPAKTFLKHWLRMTPSRFRRHWLERQLSGRGLAPRVVSSAEALALRLTELPGGLGYMTRAEWDGLEPESRGHLRLLSIQ